MSQKVSKRFIIYAVVGVVVAVIVVAAPSLVENYAASKIDARARAAGFEADWQSLELSWTGKAVMEGVEVSAPKRGIEATSDLVTLHVALDTLLGGDPRLSGVEANGTVVRWNPRATSSEDRGEGGATGGGGLEQAIEQLDFVNVVDTTIIVESDGQSYELAVNSLSVDDGYVQGRARWEDLELPGGLRFHAQNCAFRGEWPGGLAPLELEMGVANNEPVVTVTRGDSARFEVAKMTVRLEPKNRYARLDLRELSAALGDPLQPLAEVTAPVATFAFSPNHRPAAAVFGPEMMVDPGGLGGGASTSAGRSSSGRDEPSRAGVAILSALQRMDLVVEDGAVELVFGGRRLEIVEDLAVELLGQEVVAEGRSAGGSFAMSLGFGSTSLLPESAQASFEGVHLEKIPGMNEGRTLPKRGFRGRLGGVVDASVTVVRAADDDVFGSTSLAMDVDWRDGRIDVAGLADKPLEDISASFSFDSEIRPQFGSVEVRDGRASYGPMGVDFRAGVRDFPLDPTISFEASLDKIACQEAVRSAPAPILGPYDQIEIEGEAAPSLTVTLPWREPDTLTIGSRGFVDKCKVTALNADKSGWPDLRFVEPPADEPPNPSVPQPALPKDRDPSNLDDVHWLNRPFVMRVTEGVSEGAEVFVGPGLDSYVPLHELPPYVGAAAYLSEEINFYENHAVDLGHIQKALRMNLEGGEFVYGGSTVDQQLIKNLFLSRDKTLARKFQEALIAWRTEEVVSKDRILELYLNCIEYGDDLYGIGPAAKYYFGKDARELTPEEATLLAIIKPAPWYGERFKRKGTTPTEHWWFDRIGEIMGRLVEKGFITPEEAEMARPYVLQWDDEGTYLPQGEDTQADDDGWDLLDMGGGADEDGDADPSDADASAD